MSRVVMDEKIPLVTHSLASPSITISLLVVMGIIVALMLWTCWKKVSMWIGQSRSPPLYQAYPPQQQQYPPPPQQQYPPPVHRGYPPSQQYDYEEEVFTPDPNPTVRHRPRRQ